MGILIQLAIYAALAAGAALAFHAFEQHYFVGPAEIRGAADQRAQDEPILEQVKAQRDAALKQAADALTDVASCTSAVKTQSDLVSLWQSRARENFTAAAKARAEGQAAHVVAQTAVQRYQQIAAAPPVKDQTCQQKLDATDKLLRDAARARAAAKPVPKP